MCGLALALSHTFIFPKIGTSVEDCDMVIVDKQIARKAKP